MLYINATEKFGKRVLWKIFHAKNPGMTENLKTYGFKTPRSPPMDEDMKPFLDDLFGTIPMIKMRKSNNQFQMDLKKDVQRILKCEEVLVNADKTENIYKMPVNEYEKKLTEEVTKEYKKIDREQLDRVNAEAAMICEKLKIADRVEKFSEAEPFMTLKDHKENFNLRPSVRLINPSMSNVGIISKQILERINKAVRERTNANQWTCSEQPVKWFLSIEDKKKQRFIKYDIDSFYPSITKELFKKSIEYAKQFTDITEEEEEILWHARKSFVVKDGKVWVKKNGKDFDVTMGSPDGAEVAELVGLYLLNKVKKVLPNSGLYRDDGAGVAKKSGPEINKIIKRLHKIFNEEGLKITVEGNLKKIDYLDFEMDLENEIVKPWRKPNSHPKYINTSSSHPPSNIKSLPGMIQRRLSTLSSTEKEFKEVIGPYNDALKEAGYKDTNLKFMKTDQNKKRSRKRKIIWYNPPFSTNVQTNLTKMFNSLLDKHFKKGTWLYKMFNKNNCKLSYCTMPNLHQIISGHNKKLLRKKIENQNVERLCNCRGGVDNCPVEGKCLEEGVVYEADVEAESKPTKKYLGSAGTTFKVRHRNHKADFKNSHRRTATKLSGYVWKLKDHNVDHTIKFKIKEKASEYNPRTKMCMLCLTEKLRIMEADPIIFLNDRTEILCKCRHANKFKLSNLTK